jgi:hypothetical protein
MEAIPNHVENKVRVQPDKWKQLMDDYHELACFTNIEIMSWPLLFGGLSRTSKPSFCSRSTYGSAQTILTSNHFENKALGGEVVQMTTCW